MMKAKYYYIDGVNVKFDTLAEAKRHFDFYSEREKQEEIGNYIIGVSAKGEEVSYTLVRGFKKGKMIFGRTKKA